MKKRNFINSKLPSSKPSLCWLNSVDKKAVEKQIRTHLFIWSYKGAQITPELMTSLNILHS